MYQSHGSYDMGKLPMLPTPEMDGHVWGHVPYIFYHHIRVNSQAAEVCPLPPGWTSIELRSQS